MVSNIQRAAMVREQWSADFDRTFFALRFFDHTGGLVDKLTINSINGEETIWAERFLLGAGKRPVHGLFRDP